VSHFRCAPSRSLPGRPSLARIWKQAKDALKSHRFRSCGIRGRLAASPVSYARRPDDPPQDERVFATPHPPNPALELPEWTCASGIVPR
jgi:hypothetical protein